MVSYSICQHDCSTSLTVSNKYNHPGRDKETVCRPGPRESLKPLVSLCCTSAVTQIRLCWQWNEHLPKWFSGKKKQNILASDCVASSRTVNTKKYPLFFYCVILFGVWILFLTFAAEPCYTAACCWRFLWCNHRSVKSNTWSLHKTCIWCVSRIHVCIVNTDKLGHLLFVICEYSPSGSTGMC